MASMRESRDSDRFWSAHKYDRERPTVSNPKMSNPKMSNPKMSNAKMSNRVIIRTVPGEST